jgi:DNA-binding response OmpR family regulator
VRILVVDTDRELAESLVSVLARRGHLVHTSAETLAAPDAVIVGIPARDVDPARVADVPLLLLVGAVPPFGELENWIRGRSRWAMLSKPVRERDLIAALERIRRVAPVPQAPERADRSGDSPVR